MEVIFDPVLGECRTSDKTDLICATNEDIEKLFN